MAKAKKKAKTKTPSKQIPKFQKAIQEEISDFLKILEGKSVQEDISDFTKILEGKAMDLNVKSNTEEIPVYAIVRLLHRNPHEPPIDGTPGVERVMDAQLQKGFKESLAKFSVELGGVHRSFVSMSQKYNEGVGMLRTIGKYLEGPLSAAKQRELTIELNDCIDNFRRG